jgi:hypothetical protein
MSFDCATRLVLLSAAVCGCWRMAGFGAPNGGDDDGSADGDTDADSDADGDGDTDTDPDTDTESLPDDCEDGAIWIYAISHDGRLYGFDPQTIEMDLIGEIDCPTNAFVFSMAVTRDGIAHVLTYEQEPLGCAGLWAVDIYTAECLGLTGFDCDNPQGYSLLGMGYATDDDDPAAETLYVSRGWGGYEATGLAALDDATWEITPIASLSGWAELAGNGAGELFGFFGQQEDKILAHIDKQTGETETIATLDMLSGSGGTAVAFWGGDFFVFWSEPGSGQIYRVSDGVVSFVTDVGFEAVGAGSSTCAPLGTADE